MSPINAPPRDADALARLFATLVVRAGAIATEILSRPDIAMLMKADRSPVTEADQRVEAELIAALARDMPGVPVIAEEAAAAGETPAHGDSFLLIDPIDGTREFLARSNEFTVNLALVSGGAPVAGAIYAPAMGAVWFAGATGFATMAAPGAALPASQDWRELRARKAPPAGLVALISRSHLDEATQAFLARHRIAERRPMGSSVKFCRLAAGEADVYPRFGRTMEWDTAAGDAILRAAGGATLGADGAPLVYGKAQEHYRNGAFVAWGDPSATLC